MRALSAVAFVTFIMSKQPEHPLTMIPGPIEFDDAVLAGMSHYSVSHTAQPFVDVFQSVLKKLRVLFFNTDPTAQPFVIAGGGTLGWDISAANFVEPGDSVLAINTGFFSSGWAKAMVAYGADVTTLTAEIGGRPSLIEIEAALSQKRYKIVTVTHVDTSTGVLADVKAIAALTRRVSPETLVMVDGVCAIGVEELRFDEWDLDYVMTASQKAIGVPAGLSISIASGRALRCLSARKSPVAAFYHNLNHWLPVIRNYEAGKPSYFSTPPVQSIYALKASLDDIAQNAAALEQRFKIHAETSDKIKQALATQGIRLVAKDQAYAAHGLTAAYLPDEVVLPDFLAWFNKHGIVLAGGILPPISTRYFRIGHMGVSVTKYGHIDKLLKLIPQAFAELKQ